MGQQKPGEYINCCVQCGRWFRSGSAGSAGIVSNLQSWRRGPRYVTVEDGAAELGMEAKDGGPV